jgi:hypothetical protein
METVVGLFWRDEDVRRSIRKLEEEGVAPDSIDVLTRISRQRLVGDQGHPVLRSAGWGGVIGIAIYAAFGLGAALSGCNYCGYDLAYALGTLVGFVVIGGFVGALLGQWIGADASERDTHLYTRGVNLGGRLVVVRGSHESVAHAMEIFRQQNAVGVKALED